MRLLRMMIVMTVLLVASVGTSQASGDNQCAYRKAQIIANPVTARNLKIAAKRSYTCGITHTWKKQKNFNCRATGVFSKRLMSVGRFF